MRTLLISNIHGCYQEMMQLLQKVNFREQDDRIIFLGDMIDYGEDSYHVIHKVMELKAKMKERCILILGDHEKSFIDHKTPLLFGRKATTDSIESNHRDIQIIKEWLKEYCKPFWESQLFRCTHASIQKEYLPLNDIFTLTQDGQHTRMNVYTGKITITGHLDLKEATYFSGVVKPVPLEEHIWKNLPETGIICIDTDVINHGKLTIMLIKDGQYYLDSIQRINK